MTGAELVLAVTVLLVLILTAGTYLGLARARQALHRRAAARTPAPPATPRRPRRTRRQWARMVAAGLAVAGVLSAAVLRALAPTATTALHVWLYSNQTRLTLTGHGDLRCQPKRVGPVCVVSFRVRPGTEVTLTATPQRALGPEVRITYFGCDEGDDVPSCTVHATPGRAACVTTTSSADARFRTVCRRVTVLERERPAQGA